MAEFETTKFKGQLCFRLKQKTLINPCLNIKLLWKSKFLKLHLTQIIMISHSLPTFLSETGEMLAEQLSDPFNYR